MSTGVLASVRQLRYLPLTMSRRRRLADDVPRLPRGRGITLSTAQLVRIVMVAVALVALIALQKPCANSVGRFVTSFQQPDAGSAIARPDAGATPDGVMLHGSMTPAELEAAIARARAAAGSSLDAGVVAAPSLDAHP